MTRIVFGTPVGKPRMTRQDRWKQRPRVMRYRSWADEARLAFGRTTKMNLTKPMRMDVAAYFEIPKSRKDIRPRSFHTATPDSDNILKSVGDALFHNDQMITQASIRKFWAGQDGPRVEITLEVAI